MRLTREQVQNSKVLQHDDNYGYLIYKNDVQIWAKSEQNRIKVTVENEPYGDIVDKYYV